MKTLQMMGAALALGLMLGACAKQAAKIPADTGGMVALGSEVSLVVPAGSLPADTTIAIEKLAAVPAGDMGAFAGYGQAYRMTPAGTQFDLAHPALLTMKLDLAALAAAGLDPRTVLLHFLDERDGRYYAVPTQVDLDRQQISAALEHFTVYAPLAASSAVADLAPQIALQGTVPPTPRANAPLLVRATVRDTQPGGAIASAVLIAQPAGGNPVAFPMALDATANALDTYQAVIPGSLVAAGLKYWVNSTDALGTGTSSAQIAPAITNTAVAGSAACAPAFQTMTSGSTRVFSFTGRDDAGATFAVVPESVAVLNGVGAADPAAAAGVPFHAQRAGNGGLTGTAQFGNATCSITVLDGQLARIAIADANGNPFVGSLTVKEGSRTSFEALGFDAFGNQILINPNWSGTQSVTNSQLYALDLDGQSFYVSANVGGTGGVTGKQWINVAPRAWQQANPIFTSSSSMFGQPQLSATPAGFALGYWDPAQGMIVRSDASNALTGTLLSSDVPYDTSMSEGAAPVFAWTTGDHIAAAQLQSGGWAMLPVGPKVDAQSQITMLRAASGGGRTFIAWTEAPSGAATTHLYLAHWTGSGWVQDGGNFASEPVASIALAVSPAGVPYLGWNSAAATNRMLVRHWDGAQIVSDATASAPYVSAGSGVKLAFGATSGLHLLFTGYLDSTYPVAAEVGHGATFELVLSADGSRWTAFGPDATFDSGVPPIADLRIDGDTVWKLAGDRTAQLWHVGLDGTYHVRYLHSEIGFDSRSSGKAAIAVGNGAVGLAYDTFDLTSQQNALEIFALR
jgi:hypothetical protein